LIRVFLRYDRRIGFCNVAFGVDQITNPFRMLRVGRIHRPIRHADFAIDIAEQIIGKAELVSERRVFCACIAANAKYDGVFFVEVFDSITEPFAFNGSARCIGFWIPPQQDMLAAQFTELFRVAVLIGN
jgi:hypothetical protein